MNKYLKIPPLVWSTAFKYRAEFVFTQIREVVGILTLLLIWLAVYQQNQDQILGYSQAAIISYLMFGWLFDSLTSTNRINQLQALISSGDLSDFLLKPLSIWGYLVSYELADKIFGVLSLCLYLGLIYLVFRPPVYLDITWWQILVWLSLIPLVFTIKLFLSLLIASTTFWYYQNSGWAQRFLLDLIVDFASGRYFPLDFLPRLLFSGLILTPLSLLHYWPMQLFLGRISLLETGYLYLSLIVSLIGFYGLCLFVWRRGLINYQAFGR